MTYEQMSSIADVQRKQLMMVLGAFFVAMVGAILFTAFLVTSMVRNQAHALTPNTVKIIPAAVTDSSSCSVPGGSGGGEAAASAAGGSGGGGASAAMLTGGRGAGLGEGFTISGGTFSWTISRNVNSGNNYGSFNGGNTSSVSNTQNSSNSIGGNGAIISGQKADNDATTKTDVDVDKSGNTFDSNNNTTETKTVTVTKDSNNDNSDNSTNDSFNTVDLSLGLPPVYETVN